MGLENNGLKGTILSSIGELTGLAYLSLGGNGMSGTIPSSIGELTELAYMMGLIGNELTGRIPSKLAKLKKLTDPYLYENKLTGIVPPLPFEQYTINS
jgi:hypothetical protein